MPERSHNGSMLIRVRAVTENQNYRTTSMQHQSGRAIINRLNRKVWRPEIHRTWNPNLYQHTMDADLEL